MLTRIHIGPTGQQQCHHFLVATRCGRVQRLIGQGICRLIANIGTSFQEHFHCSRMSEKAGQVQHGPTIGGMFHQVHFAAGQHFLQLFGVAHGRCGIAIHCRASSKQHLSNGRLPHING